MTVTNDYLDLTWDWPETIPVVDTFKWLWWKVHSRTTQVGLRTEEMSPKPFRSVETLPRSHSGKSQDRRDVTQNFLPPFRSVETLPRSHSGCPEDIQGVLRTSKDKSRFSWCINRSRIGPRPSPLVFAHSFLSIFHYRFHTILVTNTVSVYDCNVLLTVNNIINTCKTFPFLLMLPTKFFRPEPLKYYKFFFIFEYVPVVNPFNVAPSFRSCISIFYACWAPFHAYPGFLDRFFLSAVSATNDKTIPPVSARIDTTIIKVSLKPENSTMIL